MRKDSGFTLLEMSVVIVIIGLIVAGIMGGRSLLRSATVQKAYTEYENFLTSHQAFKTKYSGVAGDFKLASTFWPSEVSTSGDGDNLLEIDNSEAFMFWQQLGLANLLPDVLSGTHSSGAAVGDSNVPRSATKGIWVANGWSADDHGYVNGTGNDYSQNAIMLVAAATLNTSTADIDSFSGLFTVEEIQAMDMKYDDGAPATGIIMCQDRNSCATTSSTDSALYDTSEDRAENGIIFRLENRL